MNIRTLILVLATLCAIDSQADDLIAQTYPISEVTGISASGDALVEITQGDSESLQVQASAEVMKRVKVDLTDHLLTLTIKNKSGTYLGWFGYGKDKVKFILQVKTLRFLELTGAVQSTIGNFSGDDLTVKNSGAAQTHFSHVQAANVRVNFSGASKLDIEKLNSEKIDVGLSGASEFDIKQPSTAKKLMIEASGASNFRGKLLVTKNAVASASGASNIDVYATETLTLSASGASTIDYFGSAKVSSESSGASDINGHQ
jgi:hypothetical protein